MTLLLCLPCSLSCLHLPLEQQLEQITLKIVSPIIPTLSPQEPLSPEFSIQPTSPSTMSPKSGSESAVSVLVPPQIISSSNEKSPSNLCNNNTQPHEQSGASQTSTAAIPSSQTPTTVTPSSENHEAATLSVDAPGVTLTNSESKTSIHNHKQGTELLQAFTGAMQCSPQSTPKPSEAQQLSASHASTAAVLLVDDAPGITAFDRESNPSSHIHKSNAGQSSIATVPCSDQPISKSSDSVHLAPLQLRFQ